MPEAAEAVTDSIERSRINAYGRYRILLIHPIAVLSDAG